MIFYFTGALLMSWVLYTLGKYSALLAVIAMVGKYAVALAGVAAVAALYVKLAPKLGLPMPLHFG